MEKQEKLGQESAFPSATNWNSGMNKRFYAACAAMQGLLSDDKYYRMYHEDYGIKAMCSRAYAIADELLKQENK